MSVSGTELALSILIMTFTVAFGIAFRNTDATHRSIERMRVRPGLFRGGILLIVLGIVLVSEADALMWLVGLTRTEPAYWMPLLAGYATCLLGVILLDTVLWKPLGRGDPTPADANY